MRTNRVLFRFLIGNLTPAAHLGIGAPVIELHQLRALAGRKGLKAERHYWRRRVQLVCPNGAVLRYPTGTHRSAAFEYGHAWRFMQGLPDVR